MKTTKKHSSYWKNRKIDWIKHYVSTWDHPHRQFIVDHLKQLRWISLVEVGCASGPNLIKIAKEIQGIEVGGIDINPEAIETARKVFEGAKVRNFFKVGDGKDLLLSDGATDVVLSDMCLIYVGPTEIMKYLREMQRVHRTYIVLHEFHSESILERVKLYIKSGYFAHNYKKLLAKLGYSNIVTIKVPVENWPTVSDPTQRQFNHLIIAKK